MAFFTVMYMFLMELRKLVPFCEEERYLKNDECSTVVHNIWSSKYCIMLNIYLFHGKIMNTMNTYITILLGKQICQTPNQVRVPAQLEVNIFFMKE